MDIAKGAHKDDKTLEVNGLKVFLEKRACDMLMNMNIDYEEGHGFVISGAQQSSCGACNC